MTRQKKKKKKKPIRRKREFLGASKMYSVRLTREKVFETLLNKRAKEFGGISKYFRGLVLKDLVNHFPDEPLVRF